MFFWNSLAFLMIHQILTIWSLVPLTFLKPAWTSGSSRFTVNILLKCLCLHHVKNSLLRLFVDLLRNFCWCILFPWMDVGTESVPLWSLLLCCSVGKVWLWSKPRILDFESQPLYLLVVWPEVISVISLSISFFHFCKGRILPLFIAERNMILYSKCLVENQYYLFVCFSILWAFIYQNPQKLLGK